MSTKDSQKSHPIYKGMTQTSFEAFEAAKPWAGNARERVFQALLKNGPMTDEEIQAFLAMNPSTERPRRIELESEGRVVACGLSTTKAGRKALLWAAVLPRG